MERGSGIDEKTAKEDQKTITESDLSPDQNGDMPVETVKVVGLRKVPGQPLGLTVSYDKKFYLITYFIQKLHCIT